MRIKNWVTVDAAGIGGGMLEPGAYVMRIVRVVDKPANEYLEVYMDVAEGERRGFYADLKEDDMWRCKWTKSYKESAEKFFRQFLDALEVSNRGRFTVAGFSQTGDEQSMVGLELGVLFQREKYIKQSGQNKGDDGTRLNWFASVPSQDVRNGEYPKFALEIDSRNGKGGGRSGAKAAPGADVYDDVKF